MAEDGSDETQQGALLVLADRDDVITPRDSVLNRFCLLYDNPEIVQDEQLRHIPLWDLICQCC